MDENGEFHLLIPKGEHTITVSALGYKTINKSIDATTENTVVVNFILQENNTQLQVVEIFGRKEQSYKNTNLFIAIKFATKLKHVPQVVGYFGGLLTKII